MTEQRQLIERRETAPHTAVLWVRFEVHEKIPNTGELRGMAVERGERVFKVEGEDKFICIRKLNELLEKMNNESGS